MARRARRLFRGGRIIDLGAGHALLAHIMLLLDDSSPIAIAVDKMFPPCAARLHAALADEWPRLAGRIQFVTAAIDDDESVSVVRSDIVVSSHACGALTDVVLARAVGARARVVVLPCCHDLVACDHGALAGWVDAPLAIDIMRTVGLERQGYRVWTQTIPAAITPRNRLLLGQPHDDASRV
ncbi:MAG TPA: methyltransferase [Gemmatimonadaceae bacterium]